MSSATIPETTGSATFTVDGKHFKTWYIIFGDLKSGQTPLVTLHGGPGMGHHWVHKQLWVTSRIPVICYDQLGNGQSTNIRDAPKEFWTPELFMDELENLLQHLIWFIGGTKPAFAHGSFHFFYHASAMLPEDKRMILNMSHTIPSAQVNASSSTTISGVIDYIAVVAPTEKAHFALLDPTFNMLRKLTRSQSSFFVAEGKFGDLDNHVPQTVSELYACAKQLQKKILCSALTKGYEWMFLLLKLNDDGGVVYMKSDVPWPDLSAAILLYWIEHSFDDLGPDNWFEDLLSDSD